MAWTIVGLGTQTDVTSGGNITLDEHASTAQGDLIVACIAYRSNAAFSLPANWNLVATQQSSGDTDATQGIASGDTWIERQDSGTGAGADTGLFIADAVKDTAAATDTFSAVALNDSSSVTIVGAFKASPIDDSDLIYDGER